MTLQERRKAQQALIILGEKHNGAVKGTNGIQWKANKIMAIKRGLNTSPTAALESIMITGVLADAQEGRNVMTCDIPNAFIQALMLEIKDGEE
jgi:hypothetical protein